MTRRLFLAVGLAMGLPHPATGQPGANDDRPNRPPAADVRRLVTELDDPDEARRGKAIQALRLLARRVDVIGGTRQRRGEPGPPQVPGLVPVLIKAAGDKAEVNRMFALHALADTLDPAAVDALRGRLSDDSPMVRFHAACLLTEFKDASGLAEMKAALRRLREKPESAGVFDRERLMASFERITGKSFGEIPMNPHLHSDTRTAAAAEKRYQELLAAWAGWWDWMPP